MRKKVGTLLLCFILFYALVHLGRHIPHLLNGRFQIGGELTWTASILRTAADLSIAFLFVLLSYLCLFHYYPKRNYPALALLLSMSLLVTILAGYVVSSLFEQEHVPVGSYFSMSLFTNTVDLMFGIVFYFLQYSRYRELREKELQLQTRQTELSFLRAQVNPHFLFNQLNNIYALVADGSPRSLEAVSGLSDLLRYMLYDIDKPVPLSLEISYIRKYIALQQFRYEHPVLIGMTVEGDTKRMMTQPLLLIPFVENAFKHGQASTQNEQISITLHTDEKSVHFWCKNAKSNGQKEARGGIGIENVRRRLDLLYPANHTLAITNDPDYFTVDLTIRYASR